MFRRQWTPGLAGSITDPCPRHTVGGVDNRSTQCPHILIRPYNKLLLSAPTRTPFASSAEDIMLVTGLVTQWAAGWSYNEIQKVDHYEFARKKCLICQIYSINCKSADFTISGKKILLQRIQSATSSIFSCSYFCVFVLLFYLFLVCHKPEIQSQIEL